MKSKSARTAVGLTLLLAITACGGGGGVSNERSGNVDGTSIEQVANGHLRHKWPGLYIGQVEKGVFYATLILDNLNHWSLHGLESNNFYLYGLVQGLNGQTTQNQFVSPARYYPAGGNVRQGSVAVAYASDLGFNGVLDTGIQKINFTTQLTRPESHRYDEPAQLADLAGTWPSFTLNGQTGDVLIGPTGELSANMAGCRISGQLSPNKNGKNTFTVSLATAGAPCFQPFTQFSGDAVQFSSNNSEVLMVFSANSNQNQAMVLLGTR